MVIPRLASNISKHSLNFTRVDEDQGGNYTCTLSNGAGSDSVTYALDVRPSRSNGVVPVPPSPTLASSTSSSLVCHLPQFCLNFLLMFAFPKIISWPPHPDFNFSPHVCFPKVISWPPHPDGGAPVSSYTLFYRREFGSWQRREVSNPLSIIHSLCTKRGIYYPSVIHQRY